MFNQEPLNFKIVTIVVISVIVVAGFVMIISRYFSRKAVVKRKLRRMNVKTMSSVQSGETVKIAGKVEYDGIPLTAPFSGRKCAYYYVLLEHKVSSGKSSHWETLVEEEIAGNFVVREADYVARLDCSQVKSYIVQDRNYASNIFEDVTDAEEKYLSDHHIKRTNLLGFDRSFRYSEGVLEQGERIAVIGKAEWKHAGQGELSDPYGKILIIGPGVKEPLYLSDDPDT